MNSVALIVDASFGDQLKSINNENAIWIVESPLNSQSIQKLIQNSSGPRNITTFAAREDEAPLKMALRIASSLDQHHNELAQNPPYSALEVYGLSLEAGILDELTYLGFTEMIAEKDHWRLVKSEIAKDK